MKNYKIFLGNSRRRKLLVFFPFIVIGDPVFQLVQSAGI
jgi:hypothetical protein